MSHLSETDKTLQIETISVGTIKDVLDATQDFGDVCFLRLPVSDQLYADITLENTEMIASYVSVYLRSSATIIIYGDVRNLVHIHKSVATRIRYQLWIAIRREDVIISPCHTSLPHQHLGMSIYTKYNKNLKHTKTRLAYTFCPYCNKTTKDYGGKKHTYHHYGTLLSDVWRDIAVIGNEDISLVLDRLADLFAIDEYNKLLVLDLREFLKDDIKVSLPNHRTPYCTTKKRGNDSPVQLTSKLINGDCLEELNQIPDSSVDFVFVDPPYNLRKAYHGYADDLHISDYFSWCDVWITEIARILRPGCTFALLNIPLWSIRHFLHLESILEYQNWIVWDALSFPVRLIMPAHYTILCFSKGRSRELPGLTDTDTSTDIYCPDKNCFSKVLTPLKEGYCLRNTCVNHRRLTGHNDRGSLSDIWWDIHRLKHNTRRVDHPCQLPPALMYRLIALFTRKGEIVLDCFNGAGTTTLAAHQMGRRYIGIEQEKKYHDIALNRHNEIEQGLDPFRKESRLLTAKNSPVARTQKRHYKVSKKTLQLDVKRVAHILDRLPSRDDMCEYGNYPIHFFDDYFSSWGEVCAAARTTGMSELPIAETDSSTFSQETLF